MKIKYFEVKGLFGEIDISIPIRDNKIILIGYNGIGKSTILNLFYYTISRQWRKMVDQDFYSICISIDDLEEIEILRSDVQSYLEMQSDRRRISARRGYPAKIFDDVLNYIIHELPEDKFSSPRDLAKHPRRSSRYLAIEKIVSKFTIPMSVADEIYSYYVSRSVKQLPLFDDATSAVQELDAAIESSLGGRILYLPTYRRIEKDVKDVFPEFEEEIRRKLQTRRGRSRGNAHIELVEFGMDDVADKVKQRLENIRGYALAQVNGLTARYLRDVIRDEASGYSKDLSRVDQVTLNSVLEKIDDDNLTETDKETLYEVVEKINSDLPLEGNEKYIAHYVAYLSEVGKNISNLERPLRRFASACNSYLFGKKFILDNNGYKLVIKRDSGRDVDLEQLSSGEKQIVSLFSHLLLDGDIKNYIIIDEPELSLSVDWQQRFLEDLSDMPSCQLIFAVTHSPFIYENKLDEYAVDLLECEVGRQ